MILKADTILKAVKFACISSECADSKCATAKHIVQSRLISRVKVFMQCPW